MLVFFITNVRSNINLEGNEIKVEDKTNIINKKSFKPP